METFKTKEIIQKTIQSKEVWFVKSRQSREIVTQKSVETRSRKKSVPLRYISLLKTAIGGFEVGIHKVYPNAKCMGFSEINPHAIKVYKKHFGDHPELGDIRDITEESIWNR